MKYWTKEETAYVVKLSAQSPEDIFETMKDLVNGKTFFPRSVEAIRRKLIREKLIPPVPYVRVASENTSPRGGGRIEAPSMGTLTTPLSASGTCPTDLHAKIIPDTSAKLKELLEEREEELVPPVLMTFIEEKYKLPQIYVAPVRSKLTKILSLSDIHFPYANVELLKQAISENRDADKVVLNGDIMEGYAFSTFDKPAGVSPLDEYREAFAFVEWLDQLFPQVILVSGNHDVRAQRMLSTVFPKKDGVIFRADLIGRIANGEYLSATGKLTQRKLKNVVYDANESWYVRVGKTIFVHPFGAGSATPGQAVLKQARAFAVRYPEVDCIVAGHTHQIYKGVVNGQLLVEQGCMTSLMHYAMPGPKAEYQNRSQNGYAVIYQDAEGNCDFNRSGPIYLGECLPGKKAIV